MDWLQHIDQHAARRMALFAEHHDALGQTVDTLLDVGDRVTAAYLAQSLGTFWETHEYLVEGARRIDRLFAESPRPELPELLQAQLYAIAGHLARHRSDYARSAAFYAQAASGSIDLPVALRTAILGGQGEIAFRQGDYAAGMRRYYEFLELGRQVGDPRLEADALNALGRFANAQGQSYEAAVLHRTSRALADEQHYVWGIACHMTALGELERSQGQIDRAAQLYADAAALFVRLRNPGFQALVSQNLAFVRLARGDIAEADALFRSVVAFWRRGGSRHGIALCLVGLAAVAHEQRRPTDAARMLGCAETLLTQAGIVLENPDRGAYETVLERVRGTLGTRYDALHRDGAQLDLERLLTGEPRVPLLTARELDVLRLVADGLPDRQIAARLAISPHTVNVHLRSVYRKLDVHTRIGALHAAQAAALL